MAKLPLKAVHISPHDIAKFENKFIGSGLGRQNEGRGLYFTDPKAPAVPWYADLLTEMNVLDKSTGKKYDKGDEFLEVHDRIFNLLNKLYTNDKDELVDLSERAVLSLLAPRSSKPLVSGEDLKIKKIVDEYFEPIDVKKPWKYDVNLNVGDPNDLPQLNTHITKQPAKYKKAIRDLVEQTFPSSDLAIEKIPDKAGTRISMKWPEPFAGKGWWTDQDPDAAIKQALNEIAYGQKQNPLRAIDRYFADKAPEKLREQGIPGFRYTTHEQIPFDKRGKLKDTVMVDDRLIDIINKSKIGIGGVVLGGAVLNPAGSDAQAKPPDPLRSIEPDFKPVDLGRQGEITNLEPKNNSLYDWSTYKLAENWFGDDRQGVEKARRFLDTTGLGNLSFAGDWVTKNIREHGLSRPEEIVGNLLAGIMPVPPGMKKGGKVVAEDLGDAYKKLGKLLGDPKVPLNHPDIEDLHSFIKDALNEQNLANKFKTLKAQQEGQASTSQIPWDKETAIAAYNSNKAKYVPDILDPTDPNIIAQSKKLDIQVAAEKANKFNTLDAYIEDSPAYNDLKNKTGEYAGKPYSDPNFSMAPYIANTNATFDDLDKFFGGHTIPAYEDLEPKQLQALDDYLANKPLVEPYEDDLEVDLNDFADDYDTKYLEGPDPYAAPHPAISHNSPSGIDASHISSHDFDEFDINKVGVGEGTIMEGHGIYGSNEPAVPPYYTRQFTVANTKAFPGDPAKQKAVEAIADNIWGTASPDEALNTTLGGYENWKTNVPHKWDNRMEETLKVLRDWSKNGMPKEAIQRPYRYDYNMDADISMFPEYRQLLGEQNPDILKKIREVYESNPHANLPLSGDWNYENAYNEIFRSNMREAGLQYPTHVGAVRFGKDQEIHSATKAQAVAIASVKKQGMEAAIADFIAKEKNFEPYVFDDIMAALNDIDEGVLSLDSSVRGVAPKDVAAKTSSQLYKAGIPGHKYLPAEGSYGDQGTRNFVSYHHEYMNILKKIKLALAAGVPTAILANQYGADDVQAAQEQQ